MESSARVGIVAALAAEAGTLGPARPAPGGLRALPDGSLCAASGIGVDAAERSARSLIAAGCGALVSWGLAGGLDPRLRPGTVVVPELSIFEGAPDLRVHSAWRERLLAVLAMVAAHRGGAAHEARAARKAHADIKLAIQGGGRLLTSRRPLASIAAKQQAFASSRALAVDMESYAVASVAAARGLPFLAVRAIVDTANDEVPAAFLDAADTHGRLAVGRLVLRSLGAPRSLGALPGLARRFGAARRALRAAARAGAPGGP